MATREATVKELYNGAAREITWEGFAAADDVGRGVDVGAYNELCVQMFGTLATTPNMIIEGSNDGSSWATLKDVHGTALSAIATTAVHQIAEKPRFIRPRFSATAGGTPDIDVRIIARRPNPSRQ